MAAKTHKNKVRGIMDRTKTYVKMSDCEEIQKLSDKFINSLFAYKVESGSCPKCGWIEHGKFCCHCGSKLKQLDRTEFRVGDSKIEGEVWLPYQCQLQEMLYTYWWGDKQPLNKVSSAIQRLVWWMDGNITKYCTGSMKQLWEAFYMFECHQKQWNGKKWVK